MCPQIVAFDGDQDLSLDSPRLIPSKEFNPSFLDIVLTKLEPLGVFPDELMSADTVPIPTLNLHHDVLVMFGRDPEIQWLVPFRAHALSNDSRPLLQLERLHFDHAEGVPFTSGLE